MANITTILGTDQISASREAINANFANLNADSAAAQAALDLKAPKASPNFTGTVTAPVISNTAIRSGFPQGFLVNGKIVTSVASNNLTVAIKTLAGADPSATDPVYVRIGNTVRTITAAVSNTMNAATNHFNAGSAELATKEIDYFVYIGWNTNAAGVMFGICRNPSGRILSDFNYITNTNEKFINLTNTALSGLSDEFEVVGRFNAILSAGAGYTWSIPATSIIVNRPIFETRWLKWTPTFSTSGTAFTNAPTLYHEATYRIEKDKAIVRLSAQYNAVSGGTGIVYAVMPFSSVDAYRTGWGTSLTGDYALSVAVGAANIANRLGWTKYDGTTAIANSALFDIAGMYQV